MSSLILPSSVRLLQANAQAKAADRRIRPF